MPHASKPPPDPGQVGPTVAERPRRKVRRTPRSRSRLVGKSPSRLPRAGGGAVRRPRRPRPTKRDLEPFTDELVWQRPPLPQVQKPPRVVERSLHVLMVGWEWPPSHSGGLGVHVFELCQELAQLRNRITFLMPFEGARTEVPGVQFRTPKDAGAMPYPGAYEIHGTPGGGWGNDDIDRYNRWIAGQPNDEFDIIHAHDWFGAVGAARLADRLGLPLVLTIHSTEYDRSLGHPWTEILQREQFGIDRADRVIAVSQHLKNQLVARYHAVPDKVRVVYNAVRPSERLSAVTSGRKIVLYLGRLAAMKGVDTFLRAAARVARTAPDTLFVVAGEGPEFPRLLALAAHLNLSDQVLFLGRVTDEERTTLLTTASVFVLPSVVEPFGIAALEAMAAGVPAIVSKTSGVAEITNSVFTVDFWDIDEFASRIAELLEYPALRQTMGEAGRVSATLEGWEERALQTVGVYFELVNRGRP